MKCHGNRGFLLKSQNKKCDKSHLKELQDGIIFNYYSLP